ncbi:MAG TPA: hypothetical protein VHB21_22675 [Minicystis sp.]|nr:hypothetical protein [Minicystis sp.]
MNRARASALSAALVAASFAPVVACTPVTEAYEQIDGPAFGTDGDTFRPVSSVMEARCGTLDCHGQVARPMRIYGQQGLRGPWMQGGKPPIGYVTNGTEQTTSDELLANYAAMIGLEPEITAKVVAGSDPPDDLTLVRKPRLEERHKGGKLWNENDPGDKCLIKWLTGVKSKATGTLDTSDCTTELQHP